MITKEHVEQLRAALESARVEPGCFIDGVVLVPESLARAWMQIADEAVKAVEKQLEDRGELLTLRARVAELERALATTQDALLSEDEKAAADEVEETLYDAVKMAAALEDIRLTATRAYETGEPLIPSEIALKCKEALR